MSKKDRKKKKPTLAEKADRHRLYEQSVQDPEAEIYFFNRTFKKIRGRRPLSMKEDFCGTAFLSTTWVKSHKDRTAVGIDLHQPTLDYAQERHVSRLKKSQRERIQLIQANVLDITTPKVDLTCALNFSHCVFKTRAQLQQYCDVAHLGLNDDGIFICELFGGTEAIVELEETRELDGFEYVWEQETYNVITSEILCHIHFDFPDKSRLKKAFTYDWRLWTIPEIRECMLKAGFADVQVYWDPAENDPKGDEYYRLTTEEENQEGWLTYIIGIR